MPRTDKYSQHSSIIWPVWLNGSVFVYELSGCGFESSCSHLNKKKSGQVAPYDWNVLRTNLDIRNTSVIQLSNRFIDLQDSMPTKSTNTTFNNFQKACKEIASNTIPLKPKVKKRKL